MLFWSRYQTKRCRAKRFTRRLIAFTAGRRAMTGSLGISRRQVLTIAAGAAGASVTGAAAVIGTSTPAKAAKAPQKNC
jgi:hypothetical protein